MSTAGSYRATGTPTHHSGTSSFQPIYALGNGLTNVADAAPGDLEWYAANDWLTIADSPAWLFESPVIPVPGGAA